MVDLNSRRVVLVLSGGGSPSGNNWSQYLQALRVREYFGSRENIELTTLFGSGLTPSSPSSATPDVLRRDAFNGPSYFVRGEIRGNKPATKLGVENYFRELKKREWRAGDSLFLFVADHGGPNRLNPTDVVIEGESVATAYGDNCVVLWSPIANPYPEERCLSLSDLKKILDASLPKTVPVTFVMNQCYSGGFHRLAYSLDEQGFPHRDMNACGFTSITEDTTAAGCTPFVDAFRYDGYERRITEAITGVSVMTGQELAPPIPNLSQAHDVALLMDDTKDVPLRTSEAFVLDLLKATDKAQRREQEEAQSSLEKQLFYLWEKIDQDDIDPEELPSPIKEDFVRRLELIQKLRAKLGEWQPAYRYQVVGASMEVLSELRKTVAKMKSGISKESDSLEEKTSELFQPFKARYLLWLKKQTDDQSKKFLEFETISKIDEPMLYTRLSMEDPTLKKYTEYLNYRRKRVGSILNWAKTQEEIKKETLQKLRGLLEQEEMYDNEMQRLQVVEGELRRLETQMRVAAGIVWMVENKHANLKELSLLIECERDSKALP